MPKRSSKDLNQTAYGIMQQATGQNVNKPAKNAAAVSLGRLGGLKGGKARAHSLSQERRVEIARKAAESRWKRKK
jgi:hypothetical protein